MRLISKNGWSIVPQDNSFLFYEMNDKGNKIGYFRCFFDRIEEINKDIYAESKLGTGYRNILQYFENDAVVPSCVKIEDGSIIITEYRDSNIYKFDTNGNLSWVNYSLGEYNNIYCLAYQNGFLWCIYPTSNIIKKFSIETFKEEISIGELDNGIFSLPEYAIIYGGLLYICDMGNHRICILDLKTYVTKEYLKFKEPTWEYFQIYGKEVIRLESGIYILD